MDEHRKQNNPSDDLNAPTPVTLDQNWAEKAKTEDGRREIIDRLIDSGANIVTREIAPQFVWLDLNAIQDLLSIVHYAYVETVNAYPADVLQIFPPVHIIHYDGSQSLNTLKREEFLAVFKRARTIEKVRLFFNLQRQGMGLQSVEINLEEWGGNKADFIKKSGNKIVAQGKNRVWVGDVLNRISEVLARSETKHEMLHSRTSELIVQLSGVGLGLIFSVRLAQMMASLRNTETRLYFFVFFFLLFSNIWTQALITLDQLRQKYLPIVRVSTTGAPSWAPIAIAGSLAIGLIGSALYEGLRLLTDWIAPLLSG